MLENISRSLVSGIAGSVLVLLLTFPSIFGIASHFWAPKTKSDAVYEDKDGVATKESEAAYSAKIPKTLLSIFSVSGLAISIVLAVLGTLNDDAFFIESWLNAAQWVNSRDSDGRNILTVSRLFWSSRPSALYQSRTPSKASIWDCVHSFLPCFSWPTFCSRTGS